ncbi:unnamed protein product [Choristocarpus tenellus]
MARNYVVTAKKATTVSHSVVCNFTGPDDVNLVLAKGSRLEIREVTSEGLPHRLDVPIYGTIATLDSYRLLSEDQDRLFVLTERYQFCILQYDADKQEIITKANGTVKDRIGRATENNKIGVLDPQNRMIGLHLYEGQFKVMPMDARGQLKEAFNVRLEELELLDIKFLVGYPKPTIAVLYQDQREARHIKTYTVNARDKEFNPGPWSQPNVEHNASELIPVPEPMGGVLILGHQTICYHSGVSFKTIPIQNTKMCAYGWVDTDGSRLLIGDHFGGLHVVILTADSTGATVETAHVEALGETSCASTISYLDNGVVFIGSSFGDSQLIKLSPEKNSDGNYIDILDTYDNLGPIMDMCVVDLDRQGQGQAVTCSGCNKDGSLHVIRNGIGINEQASTELAGIKGMWSLQDSSSSCHDKYLVQAFISETRILAIEDDEDGDHQLAEVEIQGFLPGCTIFCGGVVGDMCVQVTEKGVALISYKTLQEVHRWNPPSGLNITVATGNLSRVVLACGGGNLVHLGVDASLKKLVEEAHAKLENEIACLSLNPSNNHSTHELDLENAMPVDGVEVNNSSKSAELDALVAVGMWTDMTVRLLALPSLQEVAQQSLVGDTQARSVMIATFTGLHYLFVGLGDGHVISTTLDLTSVDKPVLGQAKKTALGSQPIGLACFQNNGAVCIFVSSDRPTVIYASGGKLLFANVNMTEVNSVCSFDSVQLPDCLALASENSLTIGTIDDIQKLHMQKIKLGEGPRRITHHEKGRVFGIITTRYHIVENSEEEEEHNFVLFLDDTHFDDVYRHALDPFEMGCSLVSCKFANDPKDYVVVGTAYVREEDFEPAVGRLLVFSVEGEGAERKVLLVAEEETRGAVYSLNEFNGKLLAGINSKVQLFKWVEKDDGIQELQTECGYHGHILALYMRSRGDFIIVGDLMRSISLLVYKSLDGCIEEIARDYHANWMTAVEMIDDDVYIGAENDCNIFTVRRNAGKLLLLLSGVLDATTEEERARLELQGEFHLGEFVNKFCQGSLTMQATDAGLSTSVEKTLVCGQPLLFGTVNGMVGAVLTLTEDNYSLLSRLQGAMTRVVRGVGGFRHEEWRSFTNARRTAEASNFLDGDLVESFLDLSSDKQEQVLKLMAEDTRLGEADAEGGGGVAAEELTLDSICRRVEEMARKH